MDLCVSFSGQILESAPYKNKARAVETRAVQRVANQRAAMYMVTSKPKRRSAAAGLVHMAESPLSRCRSRWRGRSSPWWLGMH